MSQATTVPETKAERAERLKRELNPWEVHSEIVRFAKEGYGSVPAEWLNSYFRWWGIYPQGDGVGSIGGKGGEGKAVPYFMMRIRLPHGFLFSHQLRTIAGLADRFGRGVADLTARQNIQFHWVRIEDLPEIFQTLRRCGITTMGSCGDVTRNITGCPLAGIDADEFLDTSVLVHEATQMLNGNPEFYNLPRKYKITITGCRVWCTYPEINDVGITALPHPRTGEIGFSVRVGGGLSTEPRFGDRLDAFVHWNQVLPVIRGISEIFRDSDVLRHSREKARLKFLFLIHGWTVERFQNELERRLGFSLERAVAEDPPDDIYRDHVGVHSQKQPDYSYVGLPILRGRISPAEMRGIADLADRYGSGELRLTNMQNLLIVNVRRERTEPLAAALEELGLKVHASPFWRGTVACTGTEFCKLALTETKGFARWLVEELERRMPGFDQHVKLHVTGCPNSCGQHWIADIGIEGKKVRVNGQLVDAYYFCVGGAVGKHQARARPIGLRIPATDVPDAVERLFRAYLSRRNDGENVRQFCARHRDPEIRTLLAGSDVEAVARDSSAGRPPASLDG